MKAKLVSIFVSLSTSTQYFISTLEMEKLKAFEVVIYFNAFGFFEEIILISNQEK